MRIGFATATTSLALGTEDDSFGYGSTGMKCSGHMRYDAVARPGQPPGSAFGPYGTVFGPGDCVGALLDRRSNTISFFVNGVDQGVAFHLPEAMRAVALHPAITIKGCAVQLNLGQSPMRPPEGACTFAVGGRVDAAEQAVLDAKVIGRSWAVKHSDTSSLPYAIGQMRMG